MSSMNPRNISIYDYEYELPDDRIAKYPLEERDASKVLIYQNGIIATDIYRHIDQYLPSNSLLIFNNTKVVEARILFQKPTGAVIEIFCLEPYGQFNDITIAMAKTGTVSWLCLIGGASKWKHGQILEKKIKGHENEIALQAKFIAKEKDSFVVEFSWAPAMLSFAEILHVAGIIPLPPYIKREVELADAERYQTIYAKKNGSVAAPTAGLHFTDAIFKKLDEKNIEREFVTLHVGAGTFKPVKAATMQEHEMHAEFIEIPDSVIEKILVHDNIIAVGTTLLRTIESLYWIGVKILQQPDVSSDAIGIQQWDAYEIKTNNVLAKESLKAVLSWMKKNNTERLITKTQLLIAPGYEIKIVKGLVTNFHQPQSTLLLLVAAFIGPDWKKVYQYAMDNSFRFLSYGDGCLLLRP